MESFGAEVVNAGLVDSAVVARVKAEVLKKEDVDILFLKE